jgi:hypothetical protein
MNVTLSIPERLVEEARRVAEARGISLNQMIRDELARLTAPAERDAALTELQGLWASSSGSSRGKKWTREELNERARVR